MAATSREPDSEAYQKLSHQDLYSSADFDLLIRQTPFSVWPSLDGIVLRRRVATSRGNASQRLKDRGTVRL